ncbi:hypothetical protein [Helicobacter japonicus]|uniref:Uncharacterized protein n=1 Tax=Helicobacter japonicus TaxID=425400 RepID=A0A4U8TQG7_9HELI|nr:hypothetical protein [Helicobacter japonicus]TLE02684.1 hypothetical protein LS65_001800 [Helicobacter japonicus]
MNLKDMQRREIESLKKIGLYSSVSLSTMQKICKYVSAIIVFVYLVFVQVKTPFLSYTFINVFTGAGFAFYLFKKDYFKVGLLTFYITFGGICLLGVLFYQGIFGIEHFKLQEILEIIASNNEDLHSPYQAGLLMTWSFVPPLLFTLLAALSVFMQRFESKLPALFLLYLLLLPFVWLIGCVIVGVFIIDNI